MKTAEVQEFRYGTMAIRIFGCGTIQLAQFASEKSREFLDAEVVSEEDTAPLAAALFEAAQKVSSYYYRGVEVPPAYRKGTTVAAAQRTAWMKAIDTMMDGATD